MSDTNSGRAASSSRRSLATVVAFAAFCAAIFTFLWTNSGGTVPGVSRAGYTVSVDVPRVANVVYFSDVMVAGVKVGKVRDVEERGDHARLTFELDDTVAPLHEGARVSIGAKSLVEESFVEVDDGAGPAIASGTVLPAGSGVEPTQLDDVLKSLDAPTRANLGATLRSLGASTAASRDEVVAAVRGLGDLGRRGDTVLDALAAQSDDIEGLTRNATRVLAALSQRRTQLSALVDDATTLSAATAGQQQDVQDVMVRLPGVLRSARTASGDLQQLAGSLAPVARNLTDAAPALTAALRELPATSRDLRATMPALQGALDAAPATLERTPRLASDVDGLLTPADQVLGDLNPMLGYLAPYGRDLAAWFTNFAQTVGLGDANGKAFRVMPVLNEQSLKGFPFSTNLGPLDRYNPLPKPGSLDSPGPFGDRTYPRVTREKD